MEINHRTEIHRTTVEREKSPEGSLRRCWLSEVVRKKKMVAVGFHVEVNRVILSPPSMISSFKSLYTVCRLMSSHGNLLTPSSSKGLSHMAYHGAVHSRFEHSFGVYWLAGNAVEKLKAHQQVIQGSKCRKLKKAECYDGVEFSKMFICKCF
ncbi:hypothetical protein LXL04_006302 [Taraxacum kok-saghyz]